MHDVQEALAIIEGQVRPLGPRLVPLAEALGLRLADAVRMDIDAPPFARAMLDGFAVRAVDAVAGAQLKAIGSIDAGGIPRLSLGCALPLGQGQCGRETFPRHPRA